MTEEISRNKSAEPTISDSDSRFRDFVEHAADAFFVVDPETFRIIDVNKSACESLGYSRQELLQLTVQKVSLSAPLDRISEVWDRVKTGADVTLEGIHQRKDGTEFPVEGHIGYMEYDGRPVMLALIRDISDRVEAREALLASEKRFRKIFDHSNDAVFVIDPEEDRILNANARACQMLGYSRDELLAMPISAIHPNEMPQFLEFTKSVYQNGQGWTSELSCLAKTGDIVSAEISASVIDVDGKKCILALIRDITERKKAERALRESQERLSRLVESAMDAIITIDEEKQIVLFNKAAETMFRCKRVEPMGETVDGYLSQKFCDLLTNYINDSLSEKKTHPYMWLPESLQARRANGHEFPVEATISRFEMAGQNLFTIILRDVNERKAAEEALQRLKMENIYLQEEISEEYNFGEIVGASPEMKKVFKKIESVAGTDSTVLITGETGTGKELIARTIHNLSSRKDKALVKVNCSALPGGLIESEFFGHEKGAFTGALNKKIGRFELANGGTIFLDEIGDLPLELQAKLLRVLQEGEFERVGGIETIQVNVRVIAATNRNLQQEIEENKFRADLFYRLNVFPIHIPPLRERIEDIPPLVRHFVMRHGMKLGKPVDAIPTMTMNALQFYSWPGNIRELANVIERAIIVTKGKQLELGDWLQSTNVSSGKSKVATLAQIEKEHIIDVLEITGWKVSGENGAANILGMKPTTLESRMKKLGIERKK